MKIVNDTVILTFRSVCMKYIIKTNGILNNFAIISHNVTHGVNGHGRMLNYGCKMLVSVRIIIIIVNVFVILEFYK